MSDIQKTKVQLLQELNELRSQNSKLQNTLLSDKRKIKEADKTIEKYKSVFHASPHAICLSRLSDGKYIEVNESFINIFEFSLDEVIGHTSKELGIYDSYSDREILTSTLNKQGKIRDFEVSLKTKSGKIKNCNFSAEKITTEGEEYLMAVVTDITARKNAEEVLKKHRDHLSKMVDEATEGLKQSELKFRTLSESSLAGIYIIQDGHLTYVNSATAEIFGYEPHEVIGADPFIFIHPDDHATVIENMRRRIDGEIKTIRYEFRGRCKNGETKYIQVLGALVELNGSMAFIGNFLDITERKKEAEEMRKSHELISLFMKYSPIYTFIKEVTHDKSRVIMASENFVDMIGIPGSRMTGKTMEDLFLPDFAAKITADDRAVVSKGKVLKVDEDLNDRNYTTIKYPITFEGKQLLAGYTIDITERKQAEKALQEHQQMINAIVESSRDWIWTMDLTGHHTYSNQAIEKILGYSQTEFQDMGLDLIHPEDRLIVETQWPKWIEKKQGWQNMVLRWRSKSGMYHNLESTAVPILDSQGELLGYRGVDRDITERMEAEDGLRASEERYRTLSSISSEGLMIHEKGIILEANQTFARIAGYSSPDDIIGKIGTEVIPFKPESRNIIIDHLRKNYLEAFDIELVNLKGNIVPVETRGVEIEYKGRKAKLVYMRDITERKHAEETVRLSEERLKRAEIISKSGSYELDIDSRIFFASNGAIRLIGFDKNQIEYDVFINYIQPEYRQIIETTVKNLVEGNIPFGDIEIKIKTADTGEIKTIRNMVSFDKERRTIYGAIQDITERKRMEEKIIESEAYYHTLIDTSPDAIVIINMEGNIAYGSKKAYKVFEIPAGTDVLGTSFLRWISPDYHKTVIERITEIISNNLASQVREYKLLKYNKTVFWGELSSTPLTDPDGSPTGLLIICRDVTERKKTHEDLITAKEKAEESDRLKTAFLHNISHEIRTPMNAIIGFSTILDEPRLDFESQHSYIDIIKQSSYHLLSIVSDIIEISNIEAGLIKVQSGEINVNTALKDLMTNFKTKALEKGIEIRINNMLHESVATIQTDAAKLNQVLVNLLSNSLKFTAQGNITLACKLKNDILEFSVSDTGIGIASDQQKRIFDRFYQVENSNTRQYEGTGLGLSISKAYIELMGGKIWVTSEKGNGSVFFFSIPYIPSGSIDISKKEIIKNVKVKSNRERTILIAEDEKNNYLLLVELLSSLNSNLIHALNGREAVDICKSGRQIDLILMDIKMPVMDGHAATVEIRKLYPDLPVVAMTAFAYESDREKAIASGCTDYLSKPVRKALLLETINKYV